MHYDDRFVKSSMKKTKFIAEVSSNHHQDIDRCFQFIDAASRIGCYAVKFQLFRIDQMFAPEILRKSEKHRQRKNWELPLEFIPLLYEYCKEKKIKFACTPFYLEAVDVLEPYVDFYKIASYELLWVKLLEKCAVTCKPIMLSTGMADLTEIEQAVNTINKQRNSEITLLHCVSSYPSPLVESNLAVIKTLKHKFACSVGWSDHSALPAVLYRAVHQWNAEIIEFHLDLDRKGEEYLQGHCWLPEKIENVISHINNGMSADGDGIKKPMLSEIADRDWRADPKDGLRPLIYLRSQWEQRE